MMGQRHFTLELYYRLSLDSLVTPDNFVRCIDLPPKDWSKFSVRLRAKGKGGLWVRGRTLRAKEFQNARDGTPFELGVYCRQEQQEQRLSEQTHYRWHRESGDKQNRRLSGHSNVLVFCPLEITTKRAPRYTADFCSPCSSEVSNAKAVPQNGSPFLESPYCGIEPHRGKEPEWKSLLP